MELQFSFICVSIEESSTNAMSYNANVRHESYIFRLGVLPVSDFKVCRNGLCFIQGIRITIRF